LLTISFYFTGYCFSASLPPLLSAAAIKALEHIDKYPEMLATLRERSISLHRRICLSKLIEHFTLGSDETSPLKHLYLSDESLSHSEQQSILKHIVDYVSNRSKYTTKWHINSNEK
jgi:serine palmitoyltransferase